MNIDINNLLGLEIEHFLGQSVAVLGIKGSGKSNTAAVLAEEMLKKQVPICIVDIAGEYYGLKDKFKIFTVGCSVNPETLDARLLPGSAATTAERSYQKGVPVILDVSGFDPHTRNSFLSYYMRRIWDLSLHLRYPYTIFLEEAHNYIPQSGTNDIAPIFTQIAAEGRKRGLGIVTIGQRAARIDKDVLSQADICFLHRVRSPADLNVYCDMIPRPRRDVRRMVNKLGIGDALILWLDNVRRNTIRLRSTPHGGYTPSMSDLPADRGVDSVKELIS